MCGIIGIISQTDVSERLLDGLKRLEYRGYDSAGIATLTADGEIDRRRAEGKLEKLAQVVAARPLAGTIGIGHTRWATHGGITNKMRTLWRMILLPLCIMVSSKTLPR